MISVKSFIRKGTVRLLTSVLATLDKEDPSIPMAQPNLVAHLEMIANLAMSAREAATSVTDMEHQRFHLNSIFNLLSSAEKLIEEIEIASGEKEPPPEIVEDLVQPTTLPYTDKATILSEEEFKEQLKTFL